MSDFGKKKLRKTINRLRITAINPAMLKFLEKTANIPGIVKSSGKSQVFGFLKIRNYLQENPIDRIKYITVKENLEDNSIFKDFLFRFRIIKHFFGAIFRMNNQYRHLLTKNSFSTDKNISSDPILLWKELNIYAKEKWGIQNVGFTKVPQDLVMKDRHILFKYALVFIDEMQKDLIDNAPNFSAGYETFRTYNHLGKVVLDIGSWLRKRDIRCQPNHPLGGLVNFVALAGKAGLGWQGMNGLLVTPEFGIRQRIAPIYIEQPIFPFTDSTKHAWIEEFCKNCRLCQKECPPDAIQDEKKIYNDEVETIGRLARCIDPIKCHPQFSKMIGCSVCIKVCPFSAGGNIYYSLKKTIKNQTKA